MTRAIYCHDGHRHYSPQQVETFGAARLLTQADRSACKPHRLTKENGMKALIENKIKAVVGAVITAVVAYVGTAIISGTVLTAHGLELAAAGAALTFLGVHQAPKNKPRRRAGDAGMTLIEALVTIFVAFLLVPLLILILVHHIH